MSDELDHIVDANKMVAGGLHQTAVSYNPSAEECSLVNVPGEEEIARLVAGGMSRDNHALAFDTARKILALFDPILAEKEQAEADARVFKINATSKLRSAEARALAAEAALAGLRQNILDADVICDDDEKAEARLSRLAAAIRAQE